ncbi:NAD-specific glutamate dehydrogenase [Striga asiatica]|uniref:NAD-specific glutamate dehydrogenase n=1 Tax=Striga asiatica TaxID=4170 RepID=A0A5A7PJ76_STRAF|nr:NAD-specific glutamate dehydrogenase [Striga asiatica]
MANSLQSTGLHINFINDRAAKALKLPHIVVELIHTGLHPIHPHPLNNQRRRILHHCPVGHRQPSCSLDSVPHIISITLEDVPSFGPPLNLFILCLVPGGIPHYPINLLFRQPPFFVCYSDPVCSARRPLFGRHTEYAVDVNFKAHVHLLQAPRGRWYSLQREIPEQDSRLHGSPVRNSLIWVNAPAQLLSLENTLQHLLNLGNPARASNENDIMDGSLLHPSISQAALDGLDAFFEQVHVEILEFSTSNARVEVNSLVQTLNVHGPRVFGKVLVVLALELFGKVIDNAVVEILPAKVSVASSGPHLKVEAIGNGSSSGLVDDADDIEAGNGTGILGSLSLRVAKVGRDVSNPYTAVLYGRIRRPCRVGLLGLCTVSVVLCLQQRRHILLPEKKLKTPLIAPPFPSLFPKLAGVFATGVGGDDIGLLGANAHADGEVEADLSPRHLEFVRASRQIRGKIPAQLSGLFDVLEVFEAFLECMLTAVFQLLLQSRRG